MSGLRSAVRGRVRRLRGRALETLVNAQGPRTEPPVLIFESDDWGSIRLIDGRTRPTLERHGIDMTSCAYDRVDCLETGEDLDRLHDLLAEFHDENGSPATFTMNVVLNNPDFDAIAERAFEAYSMEPIWHSYQRYGGADLRERWRAGMASGCFVPQFHAREHLHVGLWLKDLRAGHAQTRAAFDARYFSHATQTSSRFRRNYLAAYWAESAEDLEEIAQILVDGLERFEDSFGMRSTTFVPCNYVFPEALEPLVARHGVQHIQTQRAHLNPRGRLERPPVRRRHTGQRNACAQTFGVRNVQFEPFEDHHKDWVGEAFSSINLAFQMRRPAVVSTHRANYASGISVENRDRNLRLLRALLVLVLRRWPDLRFMSTPVFASTLHGRFGLQGRSTQAGDGLLAR